MAKKSWIKPSIKSSLLTKRSITLKSRGFLLYSRLKTAIENMNEIPPAEETAYKLSLMLVTLQLSLIHSGHQPH